MASVDQSLEDIIKAKKANRGKGGGRFRQNRRSKTQLKRLSNKSNNKSSGPTKLEITNLHYAVTDDDIKELFSEFGPLKRHFVHYDSSGRSLGTAEVVYNSRQNALSAIKQYNGVPLDGRMMRIDVVGASLSQFTSNNRNRGRSRSRRGGGGRGRGSSRKPKEPVPTAEQLDADLDNYKSST